MTDALIGQWRGQLARADAWRAGDDPEPVLEALALSVALELTGDLARLPTADRERLRRLGQRALLHVGSARDDEDELEALRMAAAIARDGLRALSRRPTPAEERLRTDARVLVPPGDLVRLVEGGLDGFAAGSLAMRARRSPALMAEIALLQRVREPEAAPALRMAAADAAAVRDPSEGRLVGTLDALGAEAVLFDGSPRRLAVYAEDPQPLRLLAPELTTEDVREGYWIGRVADGVVRLEAALHAGERAEPWTLDLSVR